MDDTFIRLRRWEFNAILLESVLLASAGVGAAWGFARHVRLLPDTLLLFLMVLAIGLLYIPFESVLQRARHGGEISVIRSVVWCIAGSAIGALVYSLLR